MESENLIARAETQVSTSAEKVWNALIDPNLIKEYMMGATVESKWEKGSDITWQGEIKGKKYNDKGKILEIKPYEKLRYSHFSTLSGLEDSPENYHTITIELKGEKDKTKLTLKQDKNNSEKAKRESEKNWKSMLEGLRKVVEK